jgi:hypothetical protein
MNSTIEAQAIIKDQLLRDRQVLRMVASESLHHKSGMSYFSLSFFLLFIYDCIIDYKYISLQTSIMKS